MADEQRLDTYLKQLHEVAEVPIDTTKSIKLYIRSAETVYKQAMIYRSEGDLEKSFILFLKYSNLLLKELPKHLEYDKSSPAISALRGNLLTALDVLEATKPVLLTKYKEQEELRKRKMEREREMTEARRREQEARELAARAVKNQEVARRQRLLEATKVATPSPVNSTSHDSIPILDTPISINGGSVSPIPSPVRTARYFLENGLPLRTVYVPQSIVHSFLEMAANNTRRNLETCGVLAGILKNDEFTITTLIVPKQSSTSDTVTMLNEEDIFNIQDKKELLTLGWIHTHPTQTCFMSSVDLHTHFPYQLLMAEAIAIVCAPTQSPNYGIFRLTDPPGIGVVSKCPQRGFHHHPSEKPIYREISTPDGHAKFSNSIQLEVIDLR